MQTMQEREEKNKGTVMKHLESGCKDAIGF